MGPDQQNPLDAVKLTEAEGSVHEPALRDLLNRRSGRWWEGEHGQEESERPCWRPAAVGDHAIEAIAMVKREKWS
jgi:hypothetical protein